VPVWKLRDASLPLDRPAGAAIVNVTTDSMWEGARSGSAAQAVTDGLALAEAGFDMLDVGAVPARSGPAVPPHEEAARLVPAIERLSVLAGVPVSADTFVPEVAAGALAAGAHAVNDIGGGTDAMLEVVGDGGAGYVLMHIEGRPRADRPVPDYEDVVDRVKAFFAERIERALELGIDEEAIVVDPGLDFDKSVDHDLEILRRIGELRTLGRPVYLSLSRKDFLGAVLAGSWEGRSEASDRGDATAAAAALAVGEGVEILRLHDAESLDALRLAGEIAAVARG
jgi:dihydropteroate synthase